MLQPGYGFWIYMTAPATLRPSPKKHFQLEPGFGDTNIGLTVLP